MARGIRCETKADEKGRILKKCTSCGEFKYLDEFHSRVTGYLGVAPACRECHNDYMKNHYRNNPEVRDRVSKYEKENRIRKDYGLSLGEYETLTEGKCAICGTEEGKRYVDHDHETNQIRGALCDFCNKGIGFFRDDIDLLLRAAAYLEHFKSELKK